MAKFFSEGTDLWAVDAQYQPYEFNTCRIIIELDMGNAQMPVAAPQLLGPSGIMLPPAPFVVNGVAQPFAPRVNCEIAQTVAPYGRRIVQFASQRLGLTPIVPHPDPQDANQVLHRVYSQMDPPILQEDGVTRVFRFGATYIYFLLQPIWLLDGLIMGSMPYDITPTNQNVFAASFFQKGLQTVNPDIGPSGGMIGAAGINPSGHATLGE